MKNKKFEKNEGTSSGSKRPVLKKVGKALGFSLGGLMLGLVNTLTTGALAFLGYSWIQANIYNRHPPVKDPHAPGEVIDPNGNQFEMGSDGQIDFDVMDENEKQLLKQSFDKLILQDASSRSDFAISQIDTLISFSVIPYNLCEENNEFDKYYISILFSDQNDIFAMNYLTGEDFESSADLSRDYFADFLNYLSFDCAIDSCWKMNQTQQNIKNALDVTFVGESYLGYQQNGDEYYFIPTYTTGGAGTLYFAWASPIDAYNQDPTQLFFDELSKESQTFSSMPFASSENIQKASKIYQEKLQTDFEK